MRLQEYQEFVRLRTKLRETEEGLVAHFVSLIPPCFSAQDQWREQEASGILRRVLNGGFAEWLHDNDLDDGTCFFPNIQKAEEDFLALKDSWAPYIEVSVYLPTSSSIMVLFRMGAVSP